MASPDDDPAEPPPKPLLGPVFWALMVLAALCVAAGVLVATLGPRLLPAKPMPAPPARAAVAAPSASHEGVTP